MVSSAATGDGTKNLAFPRGFADGRDGAWNAVAAASLLNVSTYLEADR